jgi:putative FmdB family regulatory protein
MPIYEFRCPACGHDFEKIMKVDATAPGCPRCGASETARKVSLSSFQFNGSGFYTTDYRSPSAKAERASESSGSAASSSTPKSE